MGTDDAYAELGLAPGASENEVKKAWRRLASTWHPDRNPSTSASAKMQRINEALHLIRRSAPGKPAGAPHAGGTGDAKRDDTAAEPEKPSRKTEEARRPHRTIVREIELSLEQAAHGCVMSVKGRLIDPCGDCLGSGRGPKLVCVACGGAGTVRQSAWYTWFGVDSECAACSGEGSRQPACESCGGGGKSAPRDYRVDVRIPSGVRQGDLLQVREPRPKDGQPELRLDLRIELLPHPLFALSEDGTVSCEVPVDGFAWVANRSIDVPTLKGLRPLLMNREQMTYRMEGLGFPLERRGARHGDHLICIRPVFPSQLSADQDILLDQLMASIADGDDGPAARGLAEWRQTVRAWESRRCES